MSVLLFFVLSLGACKISGSAELEPNIACTKTCDDDQQICHDDCTTTCTNASGDLDQSCDTDCKTTCTDDYDSCKISCTTTN